MNDNGVAIIGSNTPTGSKIVNFLRVNNNVVYGVDKIEQDEGNRASKFYRMDLRNRDALRFFFETVQPKTVVFCGQHLEDKVEYVVIDYNYEIFLNMMMFAMNKNIKNLIVISNHDKKFPCSPTEVSWYAIELLTDIFTKAFSLNTMVIKPKDNLYKNIKQFLKEI